MGSKIGSWEGGRVVLISAFENRRPEAVSAAAVSMLELDGIAGSEICCLGDVVLAVLGMLPEVVGTLGNELGIPETCGVDAILPLALPDELESFDKEIGGFDTSCLEELAVLLIEGVGLFEGDDIEVDFGRVEDFALLFGDLDAGNEEVTVLETFGETLAGLAALVDMTENFGEELVVLALLLEAEVKACEEEDFVLDFDGLKFKHELVLETSHPPMIDGTALTPVVIAVILVPQLAACARSTLALS